MTYLTESRDALAKALYVYAHREGRDERARAWELGTIPEAMKDQRREWIDALIASGAFIPADTLADDEALIERLARAINAADDEALTRTNFEHLSATYDEQAGAVLRALAAALTERSQ